MSCFNDEKSDCTSHCFYKELTIKALKSLYTKTIGEVENFRKLNNKGIGTKFDGKRYEEEPKFIYSKMMMILENKQYQMEGVINDHLKYLHGENSLTAFTDLNFMQKLEYLSYHDSKLKIGKKSEEAKDKKEG